MSPLLWLSVFFAAPPSNNAHSCAVRGTPLLEIKQGSETDSATTTKRIYNTGAWTFDSDGATASGCFSRSELTSIRRALSRASWKVTSSPIACFAYDPNFTAYTVNGRLRYTHRMCSGKTADTVTMDAIHFVEQELAGEMPPPPPKPPIADCRVDGTPLFEIRKRSDAKEPTSTTSVYASGAWTFQPIDANGRAGALTTGCLDKVALQAIRTDVTRSPWTVTRNEVTCMAYSASFIEYYVNGTHEYTSRMCGEQHLDDKSAGAIKRIDALLANVLPSTQPPPSKPPATCRVAGDPIFEIRTRSVAHEPTSTIAIYPSGAWTFEPIDANGHEGPMTTGCFGKRTMLDIQEALEKAPWDVTTSRIVCRAYSPSFTEYYVGGRLEYTARLCGEQRLDDTSGIAIKTIEAELAKVLPTT